MLRARSAVPTLRRMVLAALAAALSSVLLAPSAIGVPPAAAGAAPLVSGETAAVPPGPLPPGFAEVTAFSGLVQPTAVRFSPDGRIFVAEKRGTIEMFDGRGDTTPTRIADLRTEVDNFWDRGLLGLALDPGFPRRPYLYALYTYDGTITGTAPRWGTPGTDDDPCPDPPGATAAGCVVSAKLVKLTLHPDGTTTKQDLIHDWCQQFPSHSIGDLVFGRDGALYVSAGDGAGWSGADYGQSGSPVNPCGDPPGGVGGAMTAPSAEGGALRAQDLRTPGDRTTLDGTVIRVSPDTGAALPDNPAATSRDPNAARIIAYGLRNPFRFTFRPGSRELWIGDVGASAWEEVDRDVAPTARVVDFGWPCYEGSGRDATFQAAGLTMCDDLYATHGAATAPWYAYPHGQPLNASDTCSTATGSSITGLAFEPARSAAYPAAYGGALFLADHSRDCIWVMRRGADGLPRPATLRPFDVGAAGPVDLEIGPRGELWYADLDGGTIRRIVWTGTGPCPSGQLRAEYFANRTLSGSPASTGCEPEPLRHDWGAGSPSGVGADNFSARWSGTVDVPTAGTYRFTATADDGIRVTVDGALVVDAWRDQSPTTYQVSRPLAAGAHSIQVEYFEHAGTALVDVTWAGVGG